VEETITESLVVDGNVDGVDDVVDKRVVDACRPDVVTVDAVLAVSVLEVVRTPVVLSLDVVLPSNKCKFLSILTL